MVTVTLVEKYNKRHAPKGNPSGGQFISGHQALALGMDVPTPTASPYIKPLKFNPLSPTVAKLYAGPNTIEINATTLDEIAYGMNGIKTSEVLSGISKVLPEIPVEHLRGIDTLNLTKINGTAAGEYWFSKREITIDPSMTALNESGEYRLSVGHTFKHEVGHAAWTTLTPEQRERFGQMVGYPDPTELRDVSWYGNDNFSSKEITLMEKLNNTPVDSVNEYGRTSVLESFAEMYTYIDWNNNKIVRFIDPDYREMMTEMAQW